MYTKLILIVTVIIFLCNFIMLLVVQKDGKSLILSVALSITEIILLMSVGWYWLQTHPLKKKGKFHKFS